MLIGESIFEAIDWTQDRFETTRPIAERTLFMLLAESAVKETDKGFLLVEAEDEVDKRYHKARGHAAKNRSKFRMGRKHQKHQMRMKNRLKHLDDCEAADDMLAAEDEK